ncbi:hypothetical protein M9980_08250 [Sphingomonas donggukensis]|uniref:Poly(3-hydroxyalkanoate) polymerase subunit PhaE n=1 Tax=Sphingomonas donggukensis TaxID=2949093 RepID=A0ABY4TQI8_9SPHN|nr:poly(R)-hydroxyalkanoic acid synthase subunit PhaE [Sphingomonas donggukensis]URW74568.1 hypothetical protein M9980_08250 [Sphingomonas donggukensis]
MTVDPASFFRDMLGQWESMANQYGAQAMKSPEAARAMGAATSAGAQLQQASKDAMGRALAAANMPSREEVTGLSERMAGVEDRLRRIETLLERIAGAPAETAAPRPKPARSKKPLKAKG